VEVRDAAGKTLLARKGWWPHGALGRDPRSGGLAVYDRSRS